MAFKKKYKFVCTRCKKKKESVDMNKRICQSCESWLKPGIGQSDIFGQTVIK